MKHTQIISVLLLYFTLHSYAQEYSRDVELVGQGAGTITLRTSGIHEKKKEALQMALKSAFDTYFHTGITGLNNGKPLISTNNKASENSYLQRFFEEGRYSMFIREYHEKEQPQKLPSKLYKSTAEVTILETALIKDLETNNLRSKTDSPERMTFEETDEMMQIPSLIVLPYKKNGSSYEKELADNFLNRTAVGQLQTAFEQKGVTTYKYEALLDNARRSQEFSKEFDNTESFDKLLIQSSMADAYVTVDMAMEDKGSTYAISISLSAYNVSTGSILGSAQNTSKMYNKNSTPVLKLCQYTLKDMLDPFLKSVSTNFAKSVTKGSTIALDVSIGNTATVDMNTPVGNNNNALWDEIRTWMKANTMNNRFRLMGRVKNNMKFSEVHVTDRDDFVSKISSFLSNTLGLENETNQDVNTIYITIK